MSVCCGFFGAVGGFIINLAVFTPTSVLQGNKPALAFMFFSIYAFINILINWYLEKKLKKDDVY